MPVHLIKLSVGSDSLEDLVAWQKARLKDMKAKGKTPELVHVTRHMPKRADEVLDGGSIYWVIKGWVVGRQKLVELRPMKKEGVPHCGLVYDKKMIPVQPRPHRAFQGWRYLPASDAPKDLAGGTGAAEMPKELQHELRMLGIL